MQYIFPKTQKPFPFRGAQRPSLKGDGFGTSSVVGLFARSGPATILSAVRALIVFSVKRSPGWSCAHIAEKVFKRVLPLFTNGNSPLAIISKTVVFWICAPRQHGCPRMICSRGAHAVLSRFACFVPNGLLVQAATTLHHSIFKMRKRINDFVSAITSCPNMRFVPDDSEVFNDDQPRPPRTDLGKLSRATMMMYIGRNHMQVSSVCGQGCAARQRRFAARFIIPNSTLTTKQTWRYL